MRLKLVFICLLFSISIFSQEKYIVTEFTGTAYVLKKPEVSSSTLIKFKKGKECNILNYVGDEFWNIKYKKYNGYVESKFLIINEEMEKAKKKFDSILNYRKQLRIKKIEELEEKERFEELNRKRIRLKKDSLRMVAINNSRRLEVEKREKEIKLKIKERRDNCHYKMNGIDEFDNVKIITTEYYEIEKESGLYISLKNYNGNKWVYISLDSDLGCASKYKNDRSFVKFKLENGKIVTFYHSADINCSDFTLIGKLRNKDILLLKNSPISSIRLQGTKYYSDISNIEYSNFFIDKLNCID
ncbi:hypothetical protein [Lacinutrix salivirga]